MNKDYMQNWTQMAGKMQKPMKDLMDLNIKTFNQLKFLKTEDLAQAKHPEELISQNISLMVENGHKVLSCMEESFHILEEAFLNITKEIKETTEKGLKEAKVDIFKNKFLDKEELFKPVTPSVKTELKASSHLGSEQASSKSGYKMETSVKAPLKTDSKKSGKKK